MEKQDVIIEPYYQRQAKDLTNLLFDKEFLAKDLSRESMDWLEDYLGYILQSQVQSAIKAHDLLKSSRK